MVRFSVIFIIPFVYNNVLITESKKDLFQNNSLCKLGCESLKVDFSSKRVICECNSDELQLSSGKFPNGSKRQKLENSAIVRYHNLVFHFLYMKVNKGTWILLIFIPLALFFPSFFYEREFKFLLSVLVSPSETAENNDEVSFKISARTSQSPSRPLSKRIACRPPSYSGAKREMTTKKKSNKYAIKHLKEISNVNESTSNYHVNFNYLKYLNHLPFKEAISYDKRNFLQMSIDTLQNQFLSSNFSLDISCFKILLLILDICLCFTFNEILFDKDYIPQNYHDNENIIIVFIYTKFSIIIYSAILTLFFHLLNHSLFSFKKQFTRIILAKRQQLLAELFQIISEIKKKFALFTTIILLIIIGLWCYLNAFYAVYPNIQNLFYFSSLTSLIFFFILIILFSFFLGFLRVTSIEIKSRALFYVASCLL